MTRKSHAAALAALSLTALAAMPAAADLYEFRHDGSVIATLDVSSGADGDLLFNLQAPRLDLLGSTSFLGALALEGSSTGTVVSVSGDAPVKIASGGGPGGDYDFRFDLTGPRQARLTDGESVQWTWAGSGRDAGSLNIGAHVQATGGGEGSLWLTAVPAIPEPSIYALMLAGLGVVGAAARRRRGGST